MKSNPFDTKIIEGEVLENKIIMWLKDNGVTSAVKIGGNFKEYDIFIASSEIKIECKNDNRAIETGNIFIETSCNDKQSGIYTTQADYWVIRAYKNRILIFKTKRIIQCIINNNFPITTHNVKQNISFKKMTACIIPINVLEKYKSNSKDLLC